MKETENPRTSRRPAWPAEIQAPNYRSRGLKESRWRLGHSLAGVGAEPTVELQLARASREKRAGSSGLAARGLPGAEPARPGAAPAASGPESGDTRLLEGGDPCYLPGRLGRGESQRPQFLFGGRDPFPCAPPAPPGPRPCRPAPVRARGPRGCGGVGPFLTAPLCPDTGTQTGPRARGVEAGRRGGAHLRVRGLSGPRAPARPPAARPSDPRGPSGRGRRLSALLLGLSLRPPGPGVDHFRPRGARALYPEGAWVRRRRAEAGSGRRSSGGGRALRGARAEGCALLCPRGRELGPGAGCGGGGRCLECRAGAGRRVPGPALRPAPPRPRPAATTRPRGSSRAGRDGASHLPPRPVCPLLRDRPGTRVGESPRTPRTSTAHFCQNSAGSSGSTPGPHRSSLGAASASCRSPQLTSPLHALILLFCPPKEERTCHFWLTT